VQSLRSWWSDRLLRNVLTNSSYLFSSNAATIVLGMVQGILAARTLGAENFGILSATVIPFVSMVSRLTSFRMSELVVKYMGQYMAEEKKDQAAAVAKAAVVADSLVSLLGFALLLLIAPLAAIYLAKDPQTAPLFTFYGIILLGNATFETATGVLQATNRFRTIALVNFGQSLITVSLILGANLTGGGINEVLIAYLVGKMFAGITLSGIAFIQLGRSLGQDWWRTPLRIIPNPRALARFALSTNLSGTVNLVTRDSETLFISFFRNPTEAGYFRIALAVINLVMLPIQPFIGTTYAEIAKTIAQKKWAATTGLLKRISALAGVWTLGAAIGLVILGEWLIARLYGAEFGPAYPAVLILLLGYGYANIFFWNRPLLLSLGMPAYPLIVAGGVGLIKTLLAFWLVPTHGYLAQAWLLTGFFLVSISVIVWRGLWEIRTQARASRPNSVTAP
jgi:O-antigen/teichoic acid export membrane protein